MGRKEISQMTFFNFVSAISIGTIGASLAINSTISIRNGTLALLGWAIFTLVLGFLDIKSKGVRKAIVGQPITVIRDGKIMEGALRQARLDMDSLNVMLRKKNAFSLADVNYAIFETDGTLSVMKKDLKQPLTKSHMNIQKSHTDKHPIPLAVVSDGQVLRGNLQQLNLDGEWLNNQLDTAGIDSLDDIFYAEVQKDGSLYIDTNDDMIH